MRLNAALITVTATISILVTLPLTRTRAARNNQIRPADLFNGRDVTDGQVPVKFRGTSALQSGLKSAFLNNVDPVSSISGTTLTIPQNTWSTRGPEGGSINALAVDPINRNIVYVGVARGGVYKSTDGGVHWSAINNGLPDLVVRNDRVKALTIDPSDTLTIYAGTYNGLIFKSTDGGMNWVEMDNGLNGNGPYVYTLAIDPRNTSTIYAGTQYSGAFKSTDGGMHWSGINSGLPTFDSTSIGVISIAIDPSNSSIVYIGTTGVGSSGGVFKSTDGGMNWSPVNTGLPIYDTYALAIDPRNTTTIYAGIYLYGVFKSTDGGMHWSAINSGLTRFDFYDNDQGLVIDPRNTSTIYAGVDGGGVYKSTDGGAHWSQTNSGLTNTQIFAQAIDPLNPSTLYVGTYGGGVFKSIDGGANWSRVNTGLIAAPVPNLAVDPSNPGVIYAYVSGDRLYKSTDGGASWRDSSDGLPVNTGGRLAIDPQNSSIIYVVNSAGVFKSTNSGVNWNKISHGWVIVSMLAIDPRNTSTIYAGTFGGNDGGVFKSTDGGANWRLSLSANVVTALAIDPSSHSTIYTGSYQGLYKSNNGGANWSAFNNGLVDITATALAVDPSEGALHAGTNVGVFDYYYDCASGYSISQTNQSFTSSGGTGRVTVTAIGGCDWTATSTVNWITVTSGGSSIGNGAVSYTVAPATGTTARTGTLTIAGLTFTVTQAGATCTYTLSSAVQSFSASAGTGSVTITAGSGCAWMSTSNVSWVIITSGASSSGGGTVSYSIANNSTGQSRTGTLTIAGQTYAVIQGGTPGQPTTNPIDSALFFVRQHYRDFLNREPDASGLDFWNNGITSCGPDAQCAEIKRINTSAAFFLSIEFQQTGNLVYKMYKASFGNLSGKPVAARRASFLADTRQIQSTPAQVIVGQGNWQAQLESNKQAFALAFVQRPAFQSAHVNQDAAAYVNSLFANAGVTPTASERGTAITAFGGGGDAGRAAALRSVAESNTVSSRLFNEAFVLMQYFGYLQRDPDSGPDSDFSGYNFWLNKLNQFNGNYIQAEMVKAFISSTEYRARFAPGSASPTPTPANNQLTIVSLSSSSFLPMTPLYVKTTGLISGSPVSVKFSNSAGFSVTEGPVRVESDGTLLLGTPIYLDPNLHQIGPGTVSIVLTQGGQSTAPVTLNILDLPSVSSYGTKLGEITHYKLIMDAMLIGQKINRLQAFQHLPGNRVDTSQALQTLESELKAVIKSRSDVDRVMADNSVVIDTGATTSDGTPMKFDKNTLDMMDRVNAIFLLQTYGTLPGATQLGSAQSTPLSEGLASGEGTQPVVYARVISHYKRNHSLPKPLGQAHKQSASAATTPKAEAGSFEKFLISLTVTKNMLAEAQSADNGKNKQGWVSTVEAMASSIAVLMDLTKTGLEFGSKATSLTKKLGIVGALIGDVVTIENAWIDDGMFIYGLATHNQALVDAVIDDLSDADTQKKNWAALIDLGTTVVSSFSGGLIQQSSDVVNGLSSVWFSTMEMTKLMDRGSGTSALEQVNQTTQDVVNNFSPGDEQDFGLVVSNATVTTNLGDFAPPSEIDLSNNGIHFDTIADPSGDFQMIVPLQASGFNYNNVDVEIIDPLSGNQLGSETVDLSAMTGTLTPITIPSVQGQCFDDDAGDPDADDPDCD